MSSNRISDNAPAPAPRLADALGALPLFPLPQVVLFPGAILPLHVFEPRYRAMIKHCMRTHGTLSVVQLADGGEDAAGHPLPIARIAGAGVVIEYEPLPDGRANILVQGVARVALDELPFEAPFRRAQGTVLEDLDNVVSNADMTALIQAATSFASEVKRRDPAFSFRLHAPVSPGALADLCAFHLVIDPAARQAVLEDLDPRSRVLRVLGELSQQQLELAGSDGPAARSSGGSGGAPN